MLMPIPPQEFRHPADTPVYGSRRCRLGPLRVGLGQTIYRRLIRLRNFPEEKSTAAGTFDWRFFCRFM